LCGKGLYCRTIKLNILGDMDAIATDIDVQDAAVAAAQEKRIRPAGNATYLVAASIAAKLFSLVFVLYANRALGPDLLGNYGLVISYVGLFGVLTDLGLGALTIRDVASDHTRAVRYVSNLLVLRTILSVIAIILIVALAPLTQARSLHEAIYVYAFALIPLSVSNTLYLVFQFSERMSYTAIISIVVAAVTAAANILVLLTGHHVLGLVIVYTAVTTGSAVVTAWFVYTRFLPFRLRLTPRGGRDCCGPLYPSGYSPYSTSSTPRLTVSSWVS